MTTEIKSIEDNVEQEFSLESVPKFLAEAFLLATKGNFDPTGPGLRERCFMTTEASIFGCLIEEMFDSFLVALPTVISIDSHGEPTGRLVPECRVVRMFKSNVESVLIPNSQQQYFYHKHLCTLFDWMPDFFTEEKIGYIKYKMEQFEESSPDKTRFELEGDETDSIHISTISWDMPEGASKEAFQYLYTGTTRQ